jgi:hypothetical protein
VAQPVPTRRPAVLRLNRLGRLAQAFGAALPVPAVGGAAGLVAVELLVLIAWGTDTRAHAGSGTALRVGADLWLLTYGVTLRLPSGQVDLFPLGLAALPLLAAASSGFRLATARAAELAPHPLRDAVRAVRSGRPVSLVRDPARRIFGAGVAVATPTPADAVAPAAAPRPRVRSGWLVLDVVAVVTAQTVLVCVVCLAASSAAGRPATATAVASAAGLSCLGAAGGVLAGHRLLGAAWRRVPAVLRVPLTAGGAAVAALGAVGAVGLGALLVARFGGVTAAARGLEPGIVGGFVLFAAQVALLPNLVVWAVCYALGPGFAAGPTVTVSPTTAGPSTLPDLPVLRLLPTAPLPGWAWLVLAVAPFAAGTVLALAVRRAVPAATLVGRLSLVLAASVVCALLIGVLAAASGGGVGTGAAARFGPAPGWAVVAALAEVAMAGAFVTSATELARRPAEHQGKGPRRPAGGRSGRLSEPPASLRS